MAHSEASKTHLVLIIIAVSQQWQQRLRREHPEFEFEFREVHNPADIPDEVWQRTEILFTGGQVYPKPEQAPNLRWIQLISAGADIATKQDIFQSDVIVTTASGVHAVNIAEYVLTTMLAWYHRLPQLAELQRKKEWPNESTKMAKYMPSELRGQTIGIVGYGSIGREVARLAQAFGMRVLALQRGQDHRDHGIQFPQVGDPEGSIPEQFYTPEHLHEMLQESDVVVIAVPLTEQTKQMFNREAFAAMKKNAFLVNIGRGEVCDQDALIQALQAGGIAGAALDVVTPEPLPEDSPLWGMSNVILSPHITGLTPHYEERAMFIFSENLKQYLWSKQLYNEVDKQQGY